MADITTNPSGGLGQLRDAAYSGAPLRDSMETLLGTQVIDPAAKWHAYVAGALKPTFGGFGASLSNAFGAYSDAQQKEAELRAKYIPLVAQAMLQRQLQASQLAQRQFELTRHFDEAGVGALTGLLGQQGPITSSQVAMTLGNLVQRGLMPPEYAQQMYATLPHGSQDPEALREAVKRMAIGRLGGKEALAEVTPQVKPTDTGAGTVFANTNPNANVPVGATVGPGGVPKVLAPSERYKVEKDPAGNSYIVDLQENTKYFPRGVEAPTAGVAPGAPKPVGAGTAPRNTTLTNKAFDEDTGKKVSAYAEDLGASLDALRNVQMRLAEMKTLVKDFQPGASGEARTKLGSWTKDLAVTLGLSPAQSESISQSIAKGDISSAQAFQKLAIQGTLDILKAANPRFTQAEFGVLTQNNPNIMLDPGSLDKMMNFMTKQYLFKTAEQQEFDAFRKGGEDLAGWQVYWNKRAQELGYIKPTEVRNASKTSLGKPTEEPVGVSRSGKKARLTSEGWVYD